MPNSNSVDNFAFLDTSGDPGGVKVLELSAFEKYISCFVTVEQPWRIFFTFMKMFPNVSFISMVIKNSVFVSINGHNFNFSEEMHSLKA